VAGHKDPVPCARAGDLGCTASFPGSGWAAARAQEQGWFHSRQEQQSYCPEHVPGWVAGWRERQAKPKIRKTFARLPALARCHDCGWGQLEAGPEDADLARLKEAAFQHADGESHRVTVTTTQTLVLEPLPG
jgi:hypothetical protein